MPHMHNVTLEQLCQTVGFTPNDNEKDAILHIDGPHYLPAGPGLAIVPHLERDMAASMHS